MGSMMTFQISGGKTGKGGQGNLNPLFCSGRICFVTGWIIPGWLDKGFFQNLDIRVKQIELCPGLCLLVVVCFIRIISIYKIGPAILIGTPG